MSKKQYALADSNGFYVTDTVQGDSEWLPTLVFCKNVRGAILFDTPKSATDFCSGSYHNAAKCSIFDVTFELEQEEWWEEGGYCESN